MVFEWFIVKVWLGIELDVSNKRYIKHFHLPFKKVKPIYFLYSNYTQSVAFYYSLYHCFFLYCLHLFQNGCESATQIWANGNPVQWLEIHPKRTYECLKAVPLTEPRKNKNSTKKGEKIYCAQFRVNQLQMKMNWDSFSSRPSSAAAVL